MKYETSNFSNNESKRQSMSPEFLQEQIRLPEDKWSLEFCKLIEEKTKNRNKHNKELREWLAMGKPESLPSEIEADREESFQLYKESIGLDENDLHTKRILDIGCGDGSFVEYLITKGITTEAYGIDVDPGNSMEDIFKDHFFKGNVEENLPVHNLDYVVSRYSMFHDWKGYAENKNLMNLTRVIEKSLYAMKQGGEMRISGISETAQATPDEEEESKINQKKWKEVLLQIAKIYEIEYTIEPLGIEVYNNYMDDTNRRINLNSVIIIRKK